MDQETVRQEEAVANDEQQNRAQAVLPGSDRENESAGQAPDAVAALEDRLRRALADLDNLRKRQARELERQRAAEANRMAAAWLPVLDNLDLALGHADADPSTIIEGVRAVREQALAVLASLGFSRQDEVGVPFDPNRHEAVARVVSPEETPGNVVNEIAPGYVLNGRVLRPAMVSVAVAPDEDAA